MEVGVASLGAPAVYEAETVREDQLEFLSRPVPAWNAVDGGDAGSMVMCTVGPQHQCCRTWVGTASAQPVAVVTDLGLLDVDLAAKPARPWA